MSRGSIIRFDTTFWRRSFPVLKNGLVRKILNQVNIFASYRIRTDLVSYIKKLKTFQGFSGTMIHFFYIILVVVSITMVDIIPTPKQSWAAIWPCTIHH